MNLIIDNVVLIFASETGVLFLEEYLGDSFDSVVSCSGVVYNSSVLIIYFISHFILRCIIFFNIMIYNFICVITCWSIIFT